MFFRNLCYVHGAINILTGSAMVLALNRVSKFVHGKETTEAIFGLDSQSSEGEVTSTTNAHPLAVRVQEANALLRASEQLVGTLLTGLGLMLVVVGRVPSNTVGATGWQR